MPAWTGYSSWLQNYIAPSVHTSLLQHSFSLYITFTTLLHHFYIICTSLLHHSFSSYVTFTSVPSSVPFVHPTPFLNVLKTVFPAVPATPHGHAINCVPVHRFRIRRTSETGLTPAEWREFPRYALARILMHAVKTEPARFWRVFGWFVACFTGFPSETPWGRFSGAYNTWVMLNAPKIWMIVSSRYNYCCLFNLYRFILVICSNYTRQWRCLSVRYNLEPITRCGG